jgi:hypothetical protein
METQEEVNQSSRSSFTRIDHSDGQPVQTTSTTAPSHDPITPVDTSLPTLQNIDNTLTGDQFVSLTTELASEDLKVETETPESEPKPKPKLAMEEPVPQTPQTYLTFLLISGKRRTMSFEPSTTVCRVKELVWNSWPADWQDERPPAPSYLRVLYLGRMLQDDETLTNLKLPTFTPTQGSTSSPGPVPTIVHLSIRPYLLPEGDAIKKKKKRVQVDDNTPTGEEPNPNTDDTPCCRCIIC